MLSFVSRYCLVLAEAPKFMLRIEHEECQPMSNGTQSKVAKRPHNTCTGAGSEPLPVTLYAILVGRYSIATELVFGGHLSSGTVVSNGPGLEGKLIEAGCVLA